VIDFELVLPVGWVVLPTTPDTARLRARAIDTIIKTFLPDSLPRDSAFPWRRELRKQLVAATDDAERSGARSVVLPLSRFNGMRVPGSMIMTVLEDDAQPPPDSGQLLDSILDDAGSAGTEQEIGGARAIRVASVVEQEYMGHRASGHHVSFYLTHPERPGVWGLLTFTVMAVNTTLEDEAIQAIVLLFDSIVSTLHWAERGSAPSEDEILATLDSAAAA
jgi:hypothetical protein